MQSPSNKDSITEGLRRGDLKGFVNKLFYIDHHKSKMGEDHNIVVVSFKVNDKFPAMDLMEFIEKGYTFVLDSDISSGEEQDGTYFVFVEIERTKKLPNQIEQLVIDISKLCDQTQWRFKYYKDITSTDFSKESISTTVPLTPEDYTSRQTSYKENQVSSFLNKGATDSVELDSEDNLTVNKPYAESLKLKLVNIGEYSSLKDSISGAVRLDNMSLGETVYLNKYLGNYIIEKIDDKFLIINGNRAMIVQKRNW